MEDIEIKKAYEIVIADLKEYCQNHKCSTCPVFEGCDKCNCALHEAIRLAKVAVFGKDEENND